MINEQTPIERHYLEGKLFYVKREDLFSDYPLPSLAKIRGLFIHLKNLKEQGIKVIGVLDTRISKSGWAVAVLNYFYDLDFKVYCFYPRLINEKYLPHHQYMAKLYGAEVIPLEAGRNTILYSRAKNYIADKSNAYMLPMGITIPETPKEIHNHIIQHAEILNYKTIVVCLGTGTIASGIVSGISNKEIQIYGVSCGMSLKKIQKRMSSLITIPENFHAVSSGKDYYDVEIIDAPFPCNKYYDAKALRWLLDNYEQLNKPVLFWNVGD